MNEPSLFEFLGALLFMAGVLLADYLLQQWLRSNLPESGYFDLPPVRKEDRDGN